VNRNKNVSEILAEGETVDAALAAGVSEALRRHCQAGLPAAEWRDGKTVWITPDEIELLLRESDRSRK